MAEYDRKFSRDLNPSDTVKAKHQYFHSHVDAVRPVQRVVDIARRYRGVLPMAVASGSTNETVTLDCERERRGLLRTEGSESDYRKLAT